MSRSLARLKNLVSEIEQIQRQGQQGGRAALERTVNLKSVPEPKFLAPEPRVQIPEPKVSAPITQSVAAPDLDDPFSDLADIVDLGSKRPAASQKTDTVGKVMMQLSGKVVLSLQVENSDELVELQQLGNSIEIRFADGKAFHLPLKSVV